MGAAEPGAAQPEPSCTGPLWSLSSPYPSQPGLMGQGQEWGHAHLAPSIHPSPSSCGHARFAGPQPLVVDHSLGPFPTVVSKVHAAMSQAGTFGDYHGEAACRFMASCHRQPRLWANAACHRAQVVCSRVCNFPTASCKQPVLCSQRQLARAWTDVAY